MGSCTAGDSVLHIVLMQSSQFIQLISWLISWVCVLLQHPCKPDNQVVPNTILNRVLFVPGRLVLMCDCLMITHSHVTTVFTAEASQVIVAQVQVWLPLVRSCLLKCRFYIKLSNC